MNDDTLIIQFICFPRADITFFVGDCGHGHQLGITLIIADNDQSVFCFEADEIGSSLGKSLKGRIPGGLGRKGDPLCIERDLAVGEKILDLCAVGEEVRGDYHHRAFADHYRNRSFSDDL